MKKEFTDEQLDRMMRTLVCDASADDDVVSDIASSPATWWAIQREINAQKENPRSPWPPANIIRRWLLIAVPAAAAAGLVLSFAYFRSQPGVEQAVQPGAPSMAAVSTPPGIVQEPSPRFSNENNDIPAKLAAERNTSPSRTRPSSSVVRERKRPASLVTASTLKKTEVKTDFIALTYARDPESGQIVRVKVPSSMMVSLGVVSSVNKPGEMVDAEVVVGDDGLTRSIRFIR
jgi:hypothetical protein